MFQTVFACVWLSFRFSRNLISGSTLVSFAISTLTLTSTIQ